MKSAKAKLPTRIAPPPSQSASSPSHVFFVRDGGPKTPPSSTGTAASTPGTTTSVSVAPTHDSNGNGGVRHFHLARGSDEPAYDGQAYAEEAFNRASLAEESAAARANQAVAKYSFTQRCSVDPKYSRIFARCGLAAIVFVPLALMPVHGFMKASGLDDTLLAAYSLLFCAGVLASLLASPSREERLQPAPPIAPRVRLLYAAAWLAVPVLTRSVDWAAYLTIPTGIVGLLVVRHPCGSCWCADTYVLAMLLAPCAAITLAYTLDLADSRVVSNITVASWPMHAAHADAFAFTDGYVATEWRGRLSEWSRETGTESLSLRSAYGIAPVLPSKACLANASEFPGELTSSCPVAMIVMYSPHWESRGDGYRDINDLDIAAHFSEGGVNRGSRMDLQCAVAGWRRHRDWRGLCVYADPLYRGPNGTPLRAIEECRNLLMRHALRPLSMCDAPFFIMAHDEAARFGHIAFTAALTCSLVAGGVAVGMLRQDVTWWLRRHAARVLGTMKRGLVAIDMI